MPRPRLEEPRYSKEAQKIFDSLEPRLIELCNKIKEQRDNAATQYAYWLGFKLDIESALKKLRHRKSKRRSK